MAFATKEIETAYYVKRRIAKKEFLDKLRDVPCTDCAGVFPLCVMEFDHVPERGIKKFCVANGGNWATNSPTFLAEIAKCDVVCANCHNIRTFRRASK